MAAVMDPAAVVPDGENPIFANMPLGPLGSRIAHQQLQVAADIGDIEGIRKALSAGAEPSFINERTGNTPLYTCTGSGLLECMEILLDAGATPDQPNEGGFTAM